MVFWSPLAHKGLFLMDMCGLWWFLIAHKAPIGRIRLLLALIGALLARLRVLLSIRAAAGGAPRGPTEWSDAEAAYLIRALLGLNRALLDINKAPIGP